MYLHKQNRDRLLERLEKVNAKGVVLFEGAKSETRHDTDHEPIFRQEAYFHWAFGVKEPDFYGLIDISSKKSYLFIPKLPEEYAVWMGKIQPPEFYRNLYAVDNAFYIEDLVEVIKKCNNQTIHVIHGKDTDSGSFFKKPHFKGIEAFQIEESILFREIVECRVIKTEEELNLLRYVNQVSCKAHIEVMKRVHPGMSEYQAEAIFRYHAYHDGGARHCSYTCICGSGPNGAILHYGHAAAPNDRLIQNGDMLLFDMGAEYHCYASDITRSYPVNGKFTPEQRQIYESVLASQNAVMNAMRPGVSWVDMHRLANRVICEELKKHGFLKGDVDEMQKHHIGSLFMPHGLGHFMGINTHDVGGYPEGILRIDEPGLKSLRSGRILQEGMVITVGKIQEKKLIFKIFLKKIYQTKKINRTRNLFY